MEEEEYLLAASANKKISKSYKFDIDAIFVITDE